MERPRRGWLRRGARFAGALVSGRRSICVTTSLRRCLLPCCSNWWASFPLLLTCGSTHHGQAHGKCWGTMQVYN